MVLFACCLPLLGVISMLFLFSFSVVVVVVDVPSGLLLLLLFSPQSDDDELAEDDALDDSDNRKLSSFSSLAMSKQPHKLSNKYRNKFN